MEFCQGVLVGSCGSQCFDVQAAIVYYAENEEKVIPEDISRQWFAEVFLGLEHVHVRMRALLRDLKHQNVVLTSAGHAKLTDFGIGHLDVYAPNQQWSCGVPPGTFGFCAPEVYFNKPYNYWCDFYSLGVLLWGMRTGGIGGRGDPPVCNAGLDYRLHKNDHNILCGYVQHPYDHNVNSLEESGKYGADVRLLVERLISLHPSKRGSHAQIRGERFLEGLSVPEVIASPKQVEEWLHRRTFLASNPWC